MLFNSFEFLIFYIVVVAVFFTLPHRHRWILLLAASYYFYMSWKAEYVVLIMAATLINYGVGLGLERSTSVRLRRLLLTLGIFIESRNPLHLQIPRFFLQQCPRGPGIDQHLSRHARV